MTIMEKLNTTEAVDMVVEDGFDNLTIVDMGESITLSQVAEDGTFHNVVIGLEQAAELLLMLGRIVEDTEVA